MNKQLMPDEIALLAKPVMTRRDKLMRFAEVVRSNDRVLVFTITWSAGPTTSSTAAWSPAVLLKRLRPIRFCVMQG